MSEHESKEKEYTCIVRLPHTCNDEKWKKQCIAEGYSTDCSACTHEKAYKESLDVSNP